MRKRFSWLTQFNWRMLLMRIVINAISLAVVAILVPDIYFAQRTVRALLLVSVALGVINAIIKPLIQFLTFQLIFASYGIVIILINSLLLWLLGRFFSDWFVVNSAVWAFVGGALLGGLSSFLEALFGLTRPIVAAEDVELTALIAGEKSDVMKTFVDWKASKEQTEVPVDPALDADVTASLSPEINGATVGDAAELPTSARSPEPEIVDDVLAVADSHAGDHGVSPYASADTESMLDNQAPTDTTPYET